MRRRRDPGRFDNVLQRVGNAMKRAAISAFRNLFFRLLCLLKGDILGDENEA
jgi:hypothetical protein